jgi:hypothetical protein
MPIDFTMERWKKIKENYGLWWEGKLERPLIPVVLEGRDPGRKQPQAPLLSQTSCTDLTISAEALVDRIDYELSQYVYLGDAFPYFNMDCFGPGVVAAFLGAELDNSKGRVWFHPKKLLPITELHFEYDLKNVWLNRIKEICAVAMRRWQGQVLLGMPDLGGCLDILSTFRPADSLLLDLYDYPEEVIRLIWEIHHLWHRFYNEINETLQPVNPGYSDWSQLYSAEPSYIPQSDFSYMISPAMFEEFSRPELEATCQRLFHTIYHLDGVGQLNHLDSLLNIKELNAVQWVPGEGKPAQTEWPEVYQKIRQSGKGIQVYEGFDCIEIIAKQIGTIMGIHTTAVRGHLSEETQFKKKLGKYGIED